MGYRRHIGDSGAGGRPFLSEHSTEAVFDWSALMTLQENFSGSTFGRLLT